MIDHASPHDPGQFWTRANESFADLVARTSPGTLPHPGQGEQLAAHGTTVLAVVHADGVLMAGDRRATQGNQISQRDIRKVFAADESTLIGIAGSAGFAVDLAKLFGVELAHYEKIEGTPLSFSGKANRLGGLIRDHLGLAMQGFVVVPLLAGWDPRTGSGRIMGYDATGGHYEEESFACIGSGAAFARGSLKKLYRPGLGAERAAMIALQALFDAADDDSATGGPDIVRAIYPTIASVGPDGLDEWTPDRVGSLVEAMIEQRRTGPDGAGEEPR
ncbi:MAG: proteasome subunit beta [Propionibacteriaceae bacterium]|uniref:Proteasome subunit beta n=1 Tax=Propionibacterium ruminifibrarum TaxID=1962131 RepID=A0A375I143_9ACTN|nr:proteasome subunit beta [Propionibacterium ruminifibrarum]MBE6476511.1 proteasome subunit beta [Propionibacteriaceae bacterium]SPF67099.1 proteasome endopeptidase complex [Propionibacterium ruminifibrarum]